MYFDLDAFSHFIWGCEKPVLVLTDNKSLTFFFETKEIHPSLWNFLDRVLAYNITLANVPGRPNAAADFLSGMETEPGATL